VPLLAVARFTQHDVRPGALDAPGGERRPGSGPAQRDPPRLAELDFQVAVFGHGSAVTGDAVSRFRDFAARHR
jgi:hypothetical protein